MDREDERRKKNEENCANKVKRVVTEGKTEK